MLRAPATALELIGISAGSIDQLVVTHLHYDHAGTLGAFPKAQFHLQAAEMQYATGPCMCHGQLRIPFTVDHVCEMVRHVYSGRVTFHEGDAEIAPGITVHKTGGHSRGLQCVRVATASGPVVLASDASHYYENFEQGKVFPIVVDAEDTLRGYKRLYELAASPPPHRAGARPARVAALSGAQQPDGRLRTAWMCRGWTDAREPSGALSATFLGRRARVGVPSLRTAGLASDPNS